ncbi:proline and serine-rich 1-like protein [Labeo rohita]|uniref:Proline and serine-rich 1-like protein n=1 Tax=Labeo rohita TaxID=84645 RepID=A0A498MD84_LABRO|nr:proline and serine-rich 1-like protein [Labeo rohita]
MPLLGCTRPRSPQQGVPRLQEHFVRGLQISSDEVQTAESDRLVIGSSEGNPLDNEDDEDGLLAWWRTVEGWSEWNESKQFSEEDGERIKGLQAGSIKGYLSGIQFFHKLMFGTPSPGISNSQTSLLIRGIQRSRPTRNDPRLPITLDILTKCIHTLRTNYQPLSAARTLDAMFILAFFGFLRCSELTISSKFDPNTNPTISDLTILDNETISFLIKQSKTDQAKRGHVIYIFNLPSPIQPYQSVLEFLRLRNSQAKSPHEPLFLDEAKKPVTRFWFQKHLKSVLQSSGIPAEKFSSHSFRIGAATSAAQKGLSKQQIQTLGRWSSEAFQSYIRTNQSHIKEAHQTLIGRQAK